MARAGEEIYLASPPVPMQKPVLATLAPVGRLLGYKDHYRKYSAADDPGGAEPPSTTSVMVRAVVPGGLTGGALFVPGRAGVAPEQELSTRSRRRFGRAR